MRFINSQTDYVVERIVRAVQLPADDPFRLSTERLVDLMKEKHLVDLKNKRGRGSWNP